VFSASSGDTARPFPLSSFLSGVVGDSPLFLREVSILTLLGNETLFDPTELPLLSTCKLALADPKCWLCLCSESVNNGYDPPAAAPSLGDPISGCVSGIAITAGFSSQRG
jgi:hypothetical protein